MIVTFAVDTETNATPLEFFSGRSSCPSTIAALSPSLLLAAYISFIKPSLQVSVTNVLPVNLMAVQQTSQMTRILPSFPTFP